MLSSTVSVIWKSDEWEIISIQKNYQVRNEGSTYILFLFVSHTEQVFPVDKMILLLLNPSWKLFPGKKKMHFNNISEPFREKKRKSHQCFAAWDWSRIFCIIMLMQRFRQQWHINRRRATDTQAKQICFHPVSPPCLLLLPLLLYPFFRPLTLPLSSSDGEPLTSLVVIT